MSNVTIRDVARRAAVGVGTVSRVLNDSPNVRAVTRERVLTAIADLDYRPNANARRLSLGKTLNIGVIAPNFTTPSCVERIRGIEHTLSATPYDFMLFNVDTVARRDNHFANVPRRERIDGLILISLLPNAALEAQLAQQNIPTVLLDRKHPKFNYLGIDDVQGAKCATRHLIDLGHRRIGFVSDFFGDETVNPLGFVSPGDRYEGYCAALQEAGIHYNPLYHRQGLHAKQEAYDIALELLQLPDRPTAIFASSDTQAIGVLQAAQALNIRVPDQLSLIGYDDIDVAQYLNLTTIRQPLYESGVEAVNLLMDVMAGESQQLTQNILPLELVMRQSTSPLID